MPITKVQSNLRGSPGNVTAGNVMFALVVWNTAAGGTIADSLHCDWESVSTLSADGTTLAADINGTYPQLFMATVKSTGACAITLTGSWYDWACSELTTGTPQSWSRVANTFGHAYGASMTLGPMAAAIGDLVYAVTENGWGYPTAGAGYTQGYQYVNNSLMDEMFKEAADTSEFPSFDYGGASHWNDALAVVARPSAPVTPPTADFTTAVNLKTVTVTDASTKGTNPITGRDLYWGDGSAHATVLPATHTYTDGVPSHTLTLVVTDGTLSDSAAADVTTETRHTWTVVTDGGGSASVTADVPDA